MRNENVKLIRARVKIYLYFSFVIFVLLISASHLPNPFSELGQVMMYMSIGEKNALYVSRLTQFNSATTTEVVLKEIQFPYMFIEGKHFLNVD